MDLFFASPTDGWMITRNEIFHYGPLFETAPPESSRLAIAADKSLTLTGEPGQSYTLQASTNLSLWTDWTNVALTNTSAPLTDPAARELPQRFYRARRP